MAVHATIRILPQLQSPRGAGIIERFQNLVDRRGPDECWPWLASCKDGYGRFKIASYETVIASRVALVLETGEEHLDLHALHSCDNPPCCNPTHLRWGTPEENAIDKIERARWKGGRQDGLHNGHCKLVPGDLETIIRRLKDGYSNRHAATGLPVTESLVSRIRTGRSWAKQAAALGWVPQITPDPRRGKTRAEYSAEINRLNGPETALARCPALHSEGKFRHG
ncbi:HNH endonuclease [Sphingobium sp. CFD-1]|uniref:HNH endonuclease n=1 Tax=Sphingobium sp. CFD-1 TaxID=2878545 RepID=UPI00214A8D3F|nr:HNH endonuclease [Sphingobium sp. CFD-1]